VDHFVTVPADRFQVLNPVGTTMGPVLAVMNLQPTNPAAPRTPPAVLLDGFERMYLIDPADQDL